MTAVLSFIRNSFSVPAITRRKKFVSAANKSGPSNVLYVKSAFQTRKGGIALTERELSNAMTAYGDTVYRLALCRLQNAADAEDVYQDVFLRLLGEEARDWTASI